MEDTEENTKEKIEGDESGSSVPRNIQLYRYNSTVNGQHYTSTRLANQRQGNRTVQ